MKKEAITDIKPQEPIKAELVAHDLFLNPVKASDVIHFVNGKVFMGIGDMVELSDNELWNIATEIEYLQKMRIWSIIQETLRNQAYLKVFCPVGSPNEHELSRGGKWMLYNLDEMLAVCNLLLKGAKEKLPRGGARKYVCLLIA